MIITCERCQERLVIIKLKTNKPRITITCPVCGENIVLFTAQIQQDMERKHITERKRLERTAELLAN
ncbi:MAG: hypothetical protein P9M14_16170 [Candidatus Alcyoniella australis]|nr:hypothetical protein [Candidatus Alcyoniella australis]